MIIAAVLGLATLLAEPDVTEDEVRPGVVIRDRETRPKVPSPITITDPGVPGSAPPVREPDPFFCRPEAPFPNDDCIPPPEPVEPADPDEPEVTPGDVVEAVKRVGLPRLTVAVQPAGSTLVNLETIFHTQAPAFARTVPILGSDVTLRAAPAAYTWHHGDGTIQTTSNPGRPYPAMDVIHRYRTPAHLSARVDVTYRVTYRIDDGAWQNLSTPIIAPGPATALRVREARPVLTR